MAPFALHGTLYSPADMTLPFCALCMRVAQVPVPGCGGRQRGISQLVLPSSGTNLEQPSQQRNMHIPLQSLLLSRGLGHGLISLRGHGLTLPSQAKPASQATEPTKQPGSSQLHHSLDDLGEPAAMPAGSPWWSGDESDEEASAHEKAFLDMTVSMPCVRADWGIRGIIVLHLTLNHEI